MKYCVLKLFSQTATFRNPEFQNFHKSFILPPPTTIIGFTGAALGLSPKAAQDFFYTNSIEIGVKWKNDGIASDLWKYNDFAQGGIITREIMFNNSFLIALGCADESIIEKIEKAFLEPKYALTIGSSDSLVKVITIDEVFKNQLSNEINNCLVEGDVVTEVFSYADKGLEFSIYTTSEPIVYNLPVKFNYQGDYGVRSIASRKVFSFIGEPMKLNYEIKGLLFTNEFIPLFSLT